MQIVVLDTQRSESHLDSIHTGLSAQSVDGVLAETAADPEVPSTVDFPTGLADGDEGASIVEGSGSSLPLPVGEALADPAPTPAIAAPVTSRWA